jgi:WD40 repeat protein
VAPSCQSPDADEYPPPADPALVAAAAAALPPAGGGIGVAAGGPLRVVAGYADGALRVWRASDGAMMLSVRHAHEGPIRAVAVLAGGATAVTAGGGGDDASGALRVWTLAPTSAQLAATLLAPREDGQAPGSTAEPAVDASVRALCALDARRLAAACADGGIALWNVPGRTCDLVLRGHVGAVLSLVPLPAAELASGGADGVVRIWGTWDGTCERQMRGHGAPVLSLAAVDAGTLLASGADDGSLRLWSVETGDCLAQMAAHSPSPCLALCELPNGRLASAGGDGGVGVWQPRGAVRDATLQWASAQRGRGLAHPAALLRLGSSHAAAGCEDGSLRLWRAADGDAVAMLLPDDAGGDGGDGYASGELPGVCSLALAGGPPPPGEAPARARCGPARVRDRLWCFAGGSRLC